MQRFLLVISATAVLAAQSGCGSCNSRDVPVDLVSQVPAHATIVMVLNVSAMAEDLRAATPYAEHAGRWHDLGDDLNDYLSAQLGVGLLGAERIVVWSDGEDDWGGYLEGDFSGEIRGETQEIEGHRAIELEDGAWLTLHDGAVIIGTRGGLSDTLAVVAGGAESLEDSDSERAEVLRDLLGGIGGEGLAVAMYGGLDALTDDVIPIPIEQPRAIAFGSTPERLIARVRFSDDAAAESTVEGLQAVRGAALQGLRLAATSARAGDPPEAVQAIVTQHLAELLLEELLTLDTDGPDAVIEIELGGLGGGGVALVGVLAATSIPAYLSYMRRSAEAQEDLERLYDTSRSYYEEERVDRAGNLLPPRLPAVDPSDPQNAYRSGDLDADPSPSTFVRPDGYVPRGEVSPDGTIIYRQGE